MLLNTHGWVTLLKTTIITAVALLLSVSSAFAVKESEMNKYATIFCRHYLAGGGNHLLDAVEELKFLEVLEQKRNIFYFLREDLWNMMTYKGKESVLMQLSAYYVCRNPGTSGELKTNVEVRLKTGKRVAEFSYKKDPGKFPSPGVVFVK